MTNISYDQCVPVVIWGLRLGQSFELAGFNLTALVCNVAIGPKAELGEMDLLPFTLRFCLVSFHCPSTVVVYQIPSRLSSTKTIKICLQYEQSHDGASVRP